MQRTEAALQGSGHTLPSLAASGSASALNRRTCHLPESGYIQTVETRIKSFIPRGIGDEVVSPDFRYETNALLWSDDFSGWWWADCLRHGTATYN